jgi:hypothetical protein
LTYLTGVAALEILRHEMPAGLQGADGEVGGDLNQGDDLEVIGLSVADGVVGHVGQDEVGRAPQKLHHLPVDAGMGEVRLDQGGPRDRLDRQQVDADHRGGAPLDRHLGPAARRGAEVDDPAALADQVKAVVDLEQLEGRAAAPALGPGALGPFVGQLALDPLLAGHRLGVRRLHLRAHAAAGRGPARGRAHHAAAFGLGIVFGHRRPMPSGRGTG